MLEIVCLVEKRVTGLAVISTFALTERSFHAFKVTSKKLIYRRPSNVNHPSKGLKERSMSHNHKKIPATALAARRNRRTVPGRVLKYVKMHALHHPNDCLVLDLQHHH